MKKILFFLLTGGSPWGRIIERYEVEGEFFLECKCLILSNEKGVKRLLNAQWRTITVQIERRDLFDHNVGSRYFIDPSNIAVSTPVLVG